mgnify:CR=1 FL=1
MSKETSAMVLNLAKNVQKLKAGSGHIVMNNIKHTKDLTAVVSVYDKEKAAHMVLDELYEWCEKNNYKHICDRIVEIETDMTWNKNNPV